MVKLKQLEDNLNYQIDNKERFITLFKNKVKYKYIKYKERLGLLLSDDDFSDIEQIISNFKNINLFYVIKICLIISEYYLQKLKDDIENSQNNEVFEKHLSYLNFANYISVRLNKVKNDPKYLYYTRIVIKKKFKLTQMEYSEEIKEKIKELCNKYDIKYEDSNIKYFVYN